MTSAPSLWFEPRPSRIELALVFAIGVLAVAALTFSGIPQYWRLGATVVVAIVFVFSLRRFHERHLPRCTLQPDGSWILRSNDIDTSATLQGSHDLGFLIALHFRTDAGHRIDVALGPDSIPTDMRRRLRVWLGRGNRRTSA